MRCLNFFLVVVCVLFFRKRLLLMLTSPRPAPRVAVLFLSLLLVLSLSVLVSCDKSDEPTITVDYFFMVASKPPDYEPVPKSEMVYTVTQVMKDSIRKVYPKPTVEGNDWAVVTVCDNVYRRYLTEHPEAAKYFYCEAKLNRGRMRGDIVVSYTTVKRYNF